MAITVETIDVPVNTHRQTTVTIPKGATLMQVFEAIRHAEGSGYKNLTSTILVFLQED